MENLRLVRNGEYRFLTVLKKTIYDIFNKDEKRVTYYVSDGLDIVSISPQPMGQIQGSESAPEHLDSAQIISGDRLTIQKEARDRYNEPVDIGSAVHFLSSPELYSESIVRLIPTIKLSDYLRGGVFCRGLDKQRYLNATSTENIELDTRDGQSTDSDELTTFRQSATLKLLGISSESGVPQMGCECPNCTRARSDPADRSYATSALLRIGKNEYYLIQATPDIRFQLDSVDYHNLSGVIVLDCHVGYFSGLQHFSDEIRADGQPFSLYSHESVVKYLSGEGPYNSIMSDIVTEIQEVQDGYQTNIRNCQLTFTELIGPHGRANSPHLGLIIKGPNKRVSYFEAIPELNKRIVKEINKSDIAFIDGCFYTDNILSKIKLDNKDFSLSDMHTPVKESLRQLSQSVSTDTYFININHDNILHDEDERPELGDQFGIPSEGEEFTI